ncbi:acetyltransferase [Lysinibacillus agricola]|uniref:Acetyltransferase n=1 Tax=Lysinibacillus agricola TaxID=2590012 RepID=A0ABX7ATF6_9BACI|nr:MULTISPECIES: acetyltransferase [Lysinibacillus]QQP13257.1 acetyltransferase [Lysinibacillus agricola]
MKRQYIYGAGALAREIYSTILCLNKSQAVAKFNIEAFVVDQAYFNEQDNLLMGIPVISETIFSNEEWGNCEFVIGIGESLVREKIYKKIVSKGSTLMETIIHPNALVIQGSSTAIGSYIAPNTTISIDTIIGENVIINQNCSIGHDCNIQDNSVISPGVILSGHVSIGRSSFVGSGAVILPKVNIGEYCIIGANVTLNKDLSANNKLLQVTRNIAVPIE